MEKSVASGCNASQTVQEDKNTQVECKTLIKKAGGNGRNEKHQGLVDV